MGYCIEYQKGTAVKKRRGEKRQWGWLTAAVLAAVIFASVRIAGYDRVKQFFIPGDPEVTQSAFHGFVEGIRGGTGLSESFAVFCREIIENANATP